MHIHTSMSFRVSDKFFSLVLLFPLLIQKVNLECFTAHAKTKLIAFMLAESDRTYWNHVNEPQPLLSSH